MYTIEQINGVLVVTTNNDGVSVTELPGEGGAGTIMVHNAEALRDLVATAVREQMRDQPGGFSGLDDEGQIVGPIIASRDMTAAELDALVLDPAELVCPTDANEIRQGDGATQGGSVYKPTTMEAKAVFSKKVDYEHAPGGMVNAPDTLLAEEFIKFAAGELSGQDTVLLDISMRCGNEVGGGLTPISNWWLTARR